MTLTPAYGRDYKSKKAVLEDFNADKDFEISSMYSGGRYTNKADLLHMGETSVNIRYNKLQRVVVVRIPLS